MSDNSDTTQAPAKRENILLNLIFNIVFPTLILSKLSVEERLGPTWGLVLAFCFPLGYGIWDFSQRKKTNFISILGIISVLLTGGLGLMKLGGFWFAVKEASVPALIGLMVLITHRSKRSIVRELLFNEQVIDVVKVDKALEERGARSAFELLLARSSYMLAFGFLISAVLNFVLAQVILKSPAGTPEFNAELARMNLLSWPVIVLPSMAISMYALYYLLKGIERLTGLSFEEIFHQKK